MNKRTIDDIVEALGPRGAALRRCSVLLGAGCSISAGIPSASDIVRHIEAKFPAAYARAASHDYPDCMAALERGVRRDLIGAYIDKARINWAHIALAQLITANHVDRVLTTNFDPLVSRACALVNRFPAVYDFAASHLFNPDQVSDKAIFHLHGQRDGFVLLNTRSEVTKHRHHIKPVFNDAHKGRVWIVVGYSGENDPVFDLLASVKTFEYGLYWIGHGSKPSAHVADKLLARECGAHFLGGWDADDFFVTLAQKLQCFPPRFVTQPFSHLRSMFSMLTDYKAPRNDMDDAPDFRQSRFDVASVVRPQLDDLIQSREQSLSAEYHFLAGEYERVVALFEKRNIKRLSPEDADTYGQSLLILGNRVHSLAKADDDRAQYRLALKRFEVAAKIATTRADALYNWGNVLFDLSLAVRNGAPEVMTASAERLLRRAVVKYREAVAIDPAFADAHNNLANGLTDLARAEYPRKDNGMLREAFRHYEKATKTTQTPDVVHCNYAKSIHHLARITGDLGLYRKASAHFTIAAKVDPNYYSVFLSWGHALSDEARKTGSVKAYTAAFDKYRRAAEIHPADTGAHHSWYYALLELAKKSKGAKKKAWLEQAKSVSREQERRRRRLMKASIT
jgi:tetratricopeptide (TPR) repeat protein/NAD-dependent SIR2 family protein deacetylase